MSEGIPHEIICVDCGGTCHLISFLPEGGPPPGSVLAYRCQSCMDRWDVVWDEVEQPSEEHR